MLFFRKYLVTTVIAIILSLVTLFYLKGSHSIFYGRVLALFNKQVCTYELGASLSSTQLNKITEDLHTTSLQEIRINFRINQQNYKGSIEEVLFQTTPQLIVCEFNRSLGLFLRIGDENKFFVYPIPIKHGLQNLEIIETYDSFTIKIDGKTKLFLNKSGGNHFILNTLPLHYTKLQNSNKDLKVDNVVVSYSIGRSNLKVILILSVLGSLFWAFFITIFAFILSLSRKLLKNVNVDFLKSIVVIVTLIFLNSIFLYNLPRSIFVSFTLAISTVSYIFWRVFYVGQKNNTSEPQKSNINFWMCLCIVMGTVFMFNFLIFNKFFPLTEGWWSVTAYYINHGKLPYRDFYLCLPPLYPYQMAIFTKIFGYKFIYLRFAGIIVMVLFATNLYLIMTRFFPYFISAMLAICAILITQSFPFLVAFDFNMLILLYSSYVVLFLLYRMGESVDSKKNNLCCLLAGIMCSLIVLTKQNAGPIMIFASISILVIDAIISKRKVTTQIIMYSIGLFIPISLTLCWLLKNNIFTNFVQQVFSDAINSKGRISLVLFQWVLNLFTKDRILGISMFVNILFIFLNIRCNNYEQSVNREIKNWNGNIKYSFLTILPLVLTIIVAYCFNDYSVKILNNSNYLFFIDNMLPVSLTLFCFGIIFYGGYKIFYKKNHSRMFLSLFYVVFLSVAIIFYSTTSARDISLLTLFIPFVLFGGYILFCDSRMSLGKPIVYSMIIISVWYASAKKFNVPYQWFGDEQLNIHSSIYPARIKLLEGFYLSEDREKYLVDICSTIISKTRVTDSIFVFPHYPVLYLMSNRYPTTFALFHWIDVASDRVCREDAKRLINNPPKLIVYESDTIGIQESFFREGKRSGQRDIIDAIEIMIKQDKYRVLKRLDNLQILERVDRDVS